MKFICKPNRIDAQRFVSDQKPWPEDVQEYGAHEGQGVGAWFIFSKGKSIPINNGDWVITLANGDRTVIDNLTFAQTFIPDPNQRD